jgi:hypothetical protein
MLRLAGLASSVCSFLCNNVTELHREPMHRYLSGRLDLGA